MEKRAKQGEYSVSSPEGRVEIRVLVAENELRYAVAHAPELKGRRVRLIVLSSDDEEPYPGIAPEERLSTAASLLKYAGTWVGDDLEACLEDVSANRSKAKF